MRPAASSGCWWRRTPEQLCTPPTGEVLLYAAEHGAVQVEVRFEGDTVWLTQQQLAELFEADRTNIVHHMRNVYQEAELEESATCENLSQVRQEGSRRVRRQIPHDNLDMIISVGCRVKSGAATKFCIWATDRLKEYLVQGAAINRRRLEQLGSRVEIPAALR